MSLWYITVTCFKMKNFFIAISTIVLLTLCACSKWAGDPITQSFSIEGTYTELDIEDAFTVVVSDTVDQVVITAGENVMPKVKVINDNGLLQIYLKGWTTNRGTDLKAIIPYSPDLNKVGLHGASDFHSDFPLRASKVKVDLSGASDFHADIEADNVVADLSGSADISGNITAQTLSLDLSGSSDAALVGQVSNLKIDFSGSSSLKRQFNGNQYALACNNCEGSMSGSSDGYIHCDGSIIVKLSGSSDLHYTGNASTRGSSTSGSSDLIHDVIR